MLRHTRSKTRTPGRLRTDQALADQFGLNAGENVSPAKAAQVSAALELHREEVEATKQLFKALEQGEKLNTQSHAAQIDYAKVYGVEKNKRMSATRVADIQRQALNVNTKSEDRIAAATTGAMSRYFG